jgi:5-methyltetrahydropteroyltriglutamate--homocysteine methyltransferase
VTTTVVGSYPVPEWLKQCSDEEALGDALTVVMDAQRRAGVELICDGELGRWDLERRAPGGMVERFVRPLEGVSAELSRGQLAGYRARGELAYRSAPPGIVVGPLGDGHLDLRRDWERARARTAAPLKFTVSSPYLIAKTVADVHYGDFEALTMAFAELLCGQLAGIDAAVVQVDEPNLPGSPQDGALAAAAINRVLAGVEHGVERAVHLCFGNYGGQMIQHGDYGRLLDFMNRLQCHHLVLETTRRSPVELERLGEMRADIRLGLGVIDVKDLQIEAPDLVARRIERLVRGVGAERIAYLHPDCGLRVLPRAVADGKLRALVAGRDQFLGRGSVPG